MLFGDKLSEIRKNKKISQDELAKKIDVYAPVIIRYERNEVKHSIEVASKIAKLYCVTVDQIIHPDEKTPEEVTIEDKTTVEQVRFIQELEEKDKNTIFNIIETMLTKKKFKDFFTKNVAAL